jgi:hypothetical protein
MNQPNPGLGKPKKFSFSRAEFLEVSEHRAIMELHDSLIRRYVASVVLERLKINSKEKFIRVADDGQGIEVYDVKQSTPEKEETPKEKKPSGK